MRFLTQDEIEYLITLCCKEHGKLMPPQDDEEVAEVTKLDKMIKVLMSWAGK